MTWLIQDCKMIPAVSLVSNHQLILIFISLLQHDCRGICSKTAFSFVPDSLSKWLYHFRFIFKLPPWSSLCLSPSFHLFPWWPGLSMWPSPCWSGPSTPPQLLSKSTCRSHLFIFLISARKTSNSNEHSGSTYCL